MNDDSSIARLADSLRACAATLRPGDRLPSSREIVNTHAVSPGTVSKAIAKLVAEGRRRHPPGRGRVHRHAHDNPNETDPSWQTVALSDRVIDEAPLTSILQQPAEGVIPLTGGYLNPVLRPVQGAQRRRDQGGQAAGRLVDAAPLRHPGTADLVRR